MHHPTDRISHAFVTSVVEYWLEREIAQWVHPMKDRSEDPSHHEQTLYHGATSRSKKMVKEKLENIKNIQARIAHLMRGRAEIDPR